MLKRRAKDFSSHTDPLRHPHGKSLSDLSDAYGFIFKTLSWKCGTIFCPSARLDFTLPGEKVALWLSMLIRKVPGWSSEKKNSPFLCHVNALSQLWSHARSHTSLQNRTSFKCSPKCVGKDALMGYKSSLLFYFMKRRWNWINFILVAKYHIHKEQKTVLQFENKTIKNIFGKVLLGNVHEYLKLLCIYYSSNKWCVNQILWLFLIYLFWLGRDQRVCICD